MSQKFRANRDNISAGRDIKIIHVSIDSIPLLIFVCLISLIFAGLLSILLYLLYLREQENTESEPSSLSIVIQNNFEGNKEFSLQLPSYLNNSYGVYLNGEILTEAEITALWETNFEQLEPNLTYGNASINLKSTGNNYLVEQDDTHCYFQEFCQKTDYGIEQFIEGITSETKSTTEESNSVLPVWKAIDTSSADAIVSSLLNQEEISPVQDNIFLGFERTNTELSDSIVQELFPTPEADSREEDWQTALLPPQGFTSETESVPEPSFIFGLLVVVICLLSLGKRKK